MHVCESRPINHAIVIFRAGFEAHNIVNTPPKRILILMAEYGFGHRSAAQAIQAALTETHGDESLVQIVNAMDDAQTPAFLRQSQADYDRSVRQAPELYKLSYDASDTIALATVVESALTLMLLETIRNLLERVQPDVIVCVYQNYLAPLSAAFALMRRHIPVVTVITDLTTIHRLWFHNVSDVCVVPTRAAYTLATKYGMPPEKLKIIGIPTHPRLTQEQRAPADIRAGLGWRTDLTTVLVVGSKRVQNLMSILRVLNHSGLPLQLILVAGGDDTLYQQMTATEWHAETHVYNFVDNLSPMMHAADCIICKAGGLVVSESLACGLPILLADVIEGQETGNAQYVIEGGAGEYAHDAIEALEILYHWLANDGALLAERAGNARRLGRPRAAYEIAEVVWSTAQTPVQPLPNEA